MTGTPYSDAAFALVLFCAALVLMLAAARANGDARGYARLAAALYLALAVAQAVSFADTQASMRSFAGMVALLASAMAPPALVLTLAETFARPARPWLAACVLLAGFFCAMAAVMMNAVPFALIPLALSSATILFMGFAGAKAAALDAAYLCVAALALLAGAGAWLASSPGGLALFTAVSLLGFSFLLLRSGQLIEKSGKRSAKDTGILRKP